MKKLPFFTLAIALVASAALGAGQESAAEQTPAAGFLDSVAWQIFKDVSTAIAALTGLGGLAWVTKRNARLALQRDDHLRRREERNLAAVLHAEIRLIRSHVKAYIPLIEMWKTRKALPRNWEVQLHETPVIIYESNVDNLKLLSDKSILMQIVFIYYAITRINMTVDAIQKFEADEKATAKQLDDLLPGLALIIDNIDDVDPELEAFIRKLEA